MIYKNRELKLNNLLSLRKKMTASQINTEMKNIDLYMKERSIERNGPVVTSTFAVENLNGEQVIDMEIMVPVRNTENLTPHYNLKEEFYLTNAVYKKHTGNPELIANTYNELNSFIVENGLIPITTGYNVNVKDQSQVKNMDDMEIDIYIGVNPNKL